MCVCVCVFVPQQSHVRLPVDRITEDVTLQSRTRLLDPQKHRITGAQTHLDTHTRIVKHTLITTWWIKDWELLVSGLTAMSPCCSLIPARDAEEDRRPTCLMLSSLTLTLHVVTSWFFKVLDLKWFLGCSGWSGVSSCAIRWFTVHKPTGLGFGFRFACCGDDKWLLRHSRCLIFQKQTDFSSWWIYVVLLCCCVYLSSASSSEQLQETETRWICFFHGNTQTHTFMEEKKKKKNQWASSAGGIFLQF